MEEIQGREVAAMLNQVGRKLAEMMGKGKDDARRAARAAQIGLEIMNLESLRLELMLELGEAFFDAAGKTGKARSKAQAVLAATVAQVRELERRVASLKRAMKNPVLEGSGKRRGRPPKAKAGAPAGGKKPGRRGRPPKAAAKGGASAGGKKPGRRGRPPKAAKGGASAGGKKHGRRGRPPKAAAAAKVPASKPAQPSETQAA